MNKFNPDDYPRKVCCGVMEYFVAEGYDLPFERVIAIDQTSKGLYSLGWSIRLLKKLPNGKIASKKGPSVTIAYCPFCGKLIEHVEPGAA